MKPVIFPTWATDAGAAVTNPGVSKQADGWVVELPPLEYFNWWQNLVGQWVEYFDVQIDAVAAQANNYDAIVGVGGTHATLAAALAAAVAGWRILVKDTQLLEAEVVLDGLNDIEIDIKPGKQITQASGLLSGLVLRNCNRVKIIGGRFFNFNDVGAIALTIEATAKNTLVDRTYFFQNETDVSDLSASSNIQAIQEVA